MSNTYVVMQRDTDLFGTKTTFRETTDLPWSVTFSIWTRFRVRSRVVFASDGKYGFSPYMFKGSTAALSTAGTIFLSDQAYGNVSTEWHNIVTVVDRDTNVVTFYFDGVRKAELQLNADDLGGTEPTFGGSVEEGLVFGHHAVWNDVGYLLHEWPYSAIYGFVDEVALWSEALTEEDVRHLFERGIDPSTAMVKPETLVIHYDFEQSTEEEAYTVVPNVGIGGSKFDAVLGAYPSTAFDDPVTKWAVETEDGCVGYVDVTKPRLVVNDAKEVTNRPPIVVAQNIRVVEGDAFTFYLYAEDPEGDWIDFFTLTSLPSHGALYEVNSIDLQQQTRVYSAPYVPVYDHFHFVWHPSTEETVTVIATATDSNGATSEEAVARFVIVKKDDLPTSLDVNVTIDEDTEIDVTVRGIDLDSAFLTVVVDELPKHGSLYEIGAEPRINVSYAQYFASGEEPLEQYAMSVHAVSTFWASRPNDEFPYPYWHPFMATGPPSLDEYGDSREAWSPLNRNAPEGVFSGGDDLLMFGPWDARGTFEQDGYSEFIEIDFQVPVYLQNVFVGMPRGMGSIVGIRAWDEFTEAWQPVYEGDADPDYERYMRLMRQYSVFEPFPRACRTAAFQVSRLRIELDTVTVADWNEIDYVQLVGSRTKQAAEIRALDGAATFRYVPDTNVEGIDTFTYRFCDCGTTRCSQPATAVITVAAVNDAPVVPSIPLEVASDCDDSAVQTIQLEAADVDTNDTLTFVVTTDDVDHQFVLLRPLLNNSNSTEMMVITSEDVPYEAVDGVVYYAVKSKPRSSLTLTYAVRDSKGTEAANVGTVRIGCVSMQCIGGSYFDGGHSCVECPPGTFASGMAYRTECELCPARTFQPAAGGIFCYECSLGEFSTSDPGATECTCLPGAYKGTDDLCHLCPAGEYSEAVNSENCTSCPAGSFPTDNATDNDGAGVTFGARACVPCPAETYSTDPKAALCTPCERGRTSSGGATACNDCVERYYYDLKKQECVACVNRVQCRAGTTLATWDVERGFWRRNPESTTIYECPPGRSSCKGGIGMTGDEICGDRFIGRLCSKCDTGFYLTSRGRCRRCDEGKIAVFTVAGTMLLLLVLLLLFLSGRPLIIVDLAKIRQRLTARRHEEARISFEQHSKSLAVMLHLEEDDDGADESPGRATTMVPPHFFIDRPSKKTDDELNLRNPRPSAILRNPPLLNQSDHPSQKKRLERAQNSVALMRMYAMLSVKWKIVISTFQILASNSQSFLIEWPKTMNFILNYLAAMLNVDFLMFPQFQCFRKLNHYDHLLAATGFPLVFIAFVVFFVVTPLDGLAQSKRFCKFYERQHSRFALMLVVLFFAYSSASQTIAQTFVCQNFSDENESFLRVDLSVRCSGPAYQAWTIFALVMTVVWPIGMPTLFLPLLALQRSD